MRFLLPAAAVLAAAGSAPAQQWSTVTGTAVFGGDAVPARAAIPGVPPACLAKGPLLEEKWVVDPKTKGLRDVLVWLAPAAPGEKLPVAPNLARIPEPFVMTQPCCRFAPHVVAIRVGQDLIVENKEPIPHHLKWGGFKNPGGSGLIPAGNRTVIQGGMLVAERLPMTLNCNIHPWMEAKVGVFDHPYFAVTNEKGEFTIKDAPVGNFRLVVWHETGFLGGKAGNKGQPVVIRPGQTVVGPFKF